MGAQRGCTMDHDGVLPAWCEVLLAAAYLQDESCLGRIASRLTPEIRRRAAGFREALFSIPRDEAAGRCRSVLALSGLGTLSERFVSGEQSEAGGRR